jgi:hypothetical protein
MHRKILTVLGGLTAAAGLALAVASPALADDPLIEQTTKIISSPDDGCPPWARDTFTRTTTVVNGATEGTYTVTIVDDGTFTTQDGAKTPGDASLTITGDVTGHLHGTGYYTVTGTPLTPSQVQALTTTLDNSSDACKADVSPEKTTSAWAKRYFGEGATSTGILGWTWTYSTACEFRTENEQGATGNILGKTCPASSAPPTTVVPTCTYVSPTPTSTYTSPTPTTTVTPTSTYVSPAATPTVTVTPIATHPATPSAVPVADTGSLPVTGPGVGIMASAGTAMVLLGAGAIVWTRRKRTPDFTAE